MRSIEEKALGLAGFALQAGEATPVLETQIAWLALNPY